jgi:mono/diheme cytochrome c family protein
MRKLAIWIVGSICLVDLSGCGTTSFAPPPITAEWSVKSGHTDLAMLREGRALFVHRCIECHTLPAFWRYSTEDWPKIVDSMSHRANLKHSERDAVVAYILAVRTR